TDIAGLFRSEDRFGGSTHPEQFEFVPDPADRKFAALADAARAPLVTSDAGLLKVGGQMTVLVLKPSEFALRFGVPDIRPGFGYQLDDLASQVPACRRSRRTQPRSRPRQSDCLQPSLFERQDWPDQHPKQRLMPWCGPRPRKSSGDGRRSA